MWSGSSMVPLAGCDNFDRPTVRDNLLVGLHRLSSTFVDFYAQTPFKQGF